jgi:hypothetical protein
MMRFRVPVLLVASLLLTAPVRAQTLSDPRLSIDPSFGVTGLSQPTTMAFSRRAAAAFATWCRECSSRRRSST